MAEMKVAELKCKQNVTQFELMKRDQEIHSLKAAIFKNVVQSSQELADAEKQNYTTFRKELEQTLGFELKDCVIDEVTFEIKKEVTQNGSSQTT